MKQQEKMKAVDEIRDRINRLHSERGAAVAEAKEMRIAYGVKSNVFSSTWNRVEKLTGQIEQAERELDAAVREAAVCIMPTSVVCELVQALDEIRLYPAWRVGQPLTANAANYDAMRAVADRAVKMFQRDQQDREVPA